MTIAAEDVPDLLVVLIQQMLDIDFVFLVSRESCVKFENSRVYKVLHLVLIYEVFSFITAAKVQDCVTNGLACGLKKEIQVFYPRDLKYEYIIKVM